MRLGELIAELRGNGVTVLEASGPVEVDVARVVEDSRLVRAGDLFVARGGTKADGAGFVADAIARGAVAVVMEQRQQGTEARRHEGNGGDCVPACLSASVPCIGVDDVALALPILAHAMAGWPARGMTCVGVTGTKGKTTVAYLLRSVLQAAGNKVGMIGTVEIDDGKSVVPADMTTPGPVELAALFARMKANGVTHCVMEVSSHALHQKRVAGIDFKVAIFTNLTGDHLDYHKTMEEYAAAKALLFAGLKEGAVAVVNADDAWASRMIEGCVARIIPVCIGTEAPTRGWAAEILELSSSQMRLNIRYDLKTKSVRGLPLTTKLIGRHNASNLICTFATVEALGFVKWIMELQRALGAPGRLQRVEWDGDFQVFVDYAHTHDALENVLTALRTTMGTAPDARYMLSGISDRDSVARDSFRAAEHGTRDDTLGDIGGTPMPRLICVFGCGGDRDRTKRPKMGAVAEKLADVVIVTSDNPRTEEPGAIIEEVCAGFAAGWQQGGKIEVEADRRAAIQKAIIMAEKGDVVLLAGKGHENYQIIGKTKHHFDDVEEATAALESRLKPVLRT